MMRKTRSKSTQSTSNKTKKKPIKVQYFERDAEKEMTCTIIKQTDCSKNIPVVIQTVPARDTVYDYKDNFIKLSSIRPPVYLVNIQHEGKPIRFHVKPIEPKQLPSQGIFYKTEKQNHILEMRYPVFNNEGLANALISSPKSYTDKLELLKPTLFAETTMKFHDKLLQTVTSKMLLSELPDIRGFTLPSLELANLKTFTDPNSFVYNKPLVFTQNVGIIGELKTVQDKGTKFKQVDLVFDTKTQLWVPKENSEKDEVNTKKFKTH